MSPREYAALVDRYMALNGVERKTPAKSFNDLANRFLAAGARVKPRG